MMTLDTTGPDVTPTRKISPTLIVAAILALALIGTAALLLTLWAPSGRSAVEVVAFVTATIAPTIVGLLALLRSDHTAQLAKVNTEKLSAATTKLDEVAANVNGHLERHEALATRITTVADALARSAVGSPAATQITDAIAATADDHTPTPAPASSPADADPLGSQT